MNENERTIDQVSLPINQVHTVGHMVIRVDIGATHYWIENKVFQRIIRHSGHQSIPKYITNVTSNLNIL